MKKMDLSSFVNQLVAELKEYEDFSIQNSFDEQKTMDEWVECFMGFCGYVDEKEEDFGFDEYDDEIYYGEDLKYEELVNRRKYKSFRDDDRY